MLMVAQDPAISCFGHLVPTTFESSIWSESDGNGAVGGNGSEGRGLAKALTVR